VKCTLTVLTVTVVVLLKRPAPLAQVRAIALTNRDVPIVEVSDEWQSNASVATAQEKSGRTNFQSELLCVSAIF
jgi:hypothetical protein